MFLGTGKAQECRAYLEYCWIIAVVTPDVFFWRDDCDEVAVKVSHRYEAMV